MSNRTRAWIVAAAAAVLMPQWACADEAPAGGCEPQTEISGARLFAENCTVCHGQDGKGGGPLAVAKNLTPPDLTALAARTNGKFPVEHVSDKLRHGGGEDADGGKTMPVWTKIFAHECGDAYARHAITELEKFLKTIQEKGAGAAGAAEK